MVTSLSAIKSMTESILSQIQKAIDKAEYDRTFTAKVVGEISDYKYRIAHNGKFYVTRSAVICEVNDFVRVCVPCNHINEMYITSVIR